MFSASSETRDRNAPTNANQIRLQTSRIRQEHRPIRYQLPARLSFRQGQPEFHRDLSGWIRDGSSCGKRASKRASKSAESLPQALQGRELRKDAGETGVTRSSRE